MTIQECGPVGYPSLASFLHSDESFSIFRRFGYVQSRLLLEKQDDLRTLEESLRRLDHEDSEENPLILQTRFEIDEQVCQYRKDLMQALEAKFSEYGP